MSAAFAAPSFSTGKRTTLTHTETCRNVAVRNSPRPQTPCARLHRSATDSAWIDEARSILGNQSAPSSFSHYARRSPSELFFEGWFVRLILPDKRNIALIFAVEYPELGTVQVVDPTAKLHISEFPRDARFYGNKRYLSVAHWGETATVLKGKSVGPLEPGEFQSLVSQGWQLSKDGSVGRINSQYGVVCWDLSFDRLLSWGPRRHRRGRHTATWLGALRMFNPGYQVLVGHGFVSSGVVEVNGRQVDCSGATLYIEKNWGRDFPKKWWWAQSNLFRETPDLTVTAVGAIREVLSMTENVGMITVHFNGEMFEFAPWTAKRILWDVQWTSWHVVALSRNGYRAELTASCKDDPTMILGPTTDGMQFTVKGRMDGWMQIEVLAPNGRTIVRDESDMARVEVGGLTREEKWTTLSEVSKQPLRGIMNLFNGARAPTTP